MEIADYHYLVMDDDEFTKLLIAGMLKKMGATKVDTADNGEVALGYLNAGMTPDIIISDLNMPQIDGVTFMRHLAEKQFAGGILLISGSDKRLLRIVVSLAKSHRLNVLGALTKPFSPVALQSMLARFDGVKSNVSTGKSSSPYLVTADALRVAIEQNQIVPFFQPKVAIRTGEVVGVEALARWQHPEKGFIPPDRFIPVAEQNGLIDLLTQDIFLKTIQQAAVWQKHDPLSFAVNFSTLSLTDTKLPDQLVKQLHAADVIPSSVTLEVTESCLLESITSMLETLLRLRLLGVELSIDDFGTGHSSLEELHKLPFSELKIDRIFVNGAAHDEETHLFLHSAVTLAKKLGLSVVAEGVETQEDWDVCAKLGCDVIQGFFIARPMPAEAFSEWHKKRKESLGLTGKVQAG